MKIALSGKKSKVEIGDILQSSGSGRYYLIARDGYSNEIRFINLENLEILRFSYKSVESAIDSFFSDTEGYKVFPSKDNELLLGGR